MQEAPAQATRILGTAEYHLVLGDRRVNASH